MSRSRQRANTEGGVISFKQKLDGKTVEPAPAPWNQSRKSLPFDDILGVKINRWVKARHMNRLLDSSKQDLKDGVMS